MDSFRERRVGIRGAVRRLVAVLCAASLTLVGLAVSVPSAHAVYATGGSGRYRGSIDWFSWGTSGTVIAAGASLTQTNTRVIGGKN
ncbi:MAG: hypothetical protein LBU38_05655, partial [Propionibacteriaceae bacterium]|nr:hypothetical protein [Propionibacteriaceae bacterium]